MKTSSLRPRFLNRNVTVLGSTGSVYTGRLCRNRYTETDEAPGTKRDNSAGADCRVTRYCVGKTPIFTTDTVTLGIEQ